MSKGVLRRDFTAPSGPGSSGVVVIGDVHGCYDPLKELVDQIKTLPYSPTVVFVGDLLDRGEQGSEVWDLVRTMYFNPRAFNAEKVVVLKGNHEQMFVDAFYSGSVKSYEFMMWMQNGGMVKDMIFINNYGADEVKWMDSLDTSYIHPTKVSFRGRELNLLVTHGAVLPKHIGGDVKDQDPEYLMWQRRLQGYGEDWLTVHGHTIQKRGPVVFPFPSGNVMRIDTGSFLTGVITGVEFVSVVK